MCVRHDEDNLIPKKGLNWDKAFELGKAPFIIKIVASRASLGLRGLYYRSDYTLK